MTKGCVIRRYTEMNDTTKGFGYANTKGFSIIPAYTRSGKFAIRILRPCELTALINAITKDYCRTQFEFLLYTGMRYIEAQNVFKRPDLFDGTQIHLIPGVITKKPRCTMSNRYVKLTPVGRKVVKDYFKIEKEPPHMNTWRENLVRWCNLAKIDPSYMSVKTTRKTYESYLMTIYPERRDEIFISQGHTELTALKNYINLPFNQKDKEEMIKYVVGWGL